MQRLLLLLLGSVVLMSGPALAALCDWRWDQVTQNVDGTPATDLAGYRLYVGTERRHDLAVSALPDPTQPGLQAPCTVGERWHVTAYDGAGNQSPPSNVVEVPDLLAPLAPAGFRVQGVNLSIELQRK